VHNLIGKFQTKTVEVNFTLIYDINISNSSYLKEKIQSYIKSFHENHKYKISYSLAKQFVKIGSSSSVFIRTSIVFGFHIYLNNITKT
jgi:hypothetical protein